MTGAASPIRSICVFCGSSFGDSPAFGTAADRLGRLLAERDLRLVYGAGGIGLMGAVARAALAAGGEVTGVIPKFLSLPEVQLDDCSELIVTENLYDRMNIMAERSDAFVVLPGGIGTVAEMVDTLTWAQLGQRPKLVIVVDIEGYWSPLRELLDHIVSRDFSHGDLKSLYRFVDDVEDVLPALGL